MIWFIIIFFVLLGCFFPRSKRVFAILTLILALIEGGYSGSIDLNVYRLSYTGAWGTAWGTDQYLFHLLERFSYQQGISFEAFSLILGAASVGLTAFVVYRLSDKPAFIMSSLAGFAMLENAAQKKTLYAAAVISFALYFYYRHIFENENRKIRDTAVYIALIAAAAGMHYFAVFFLGFLLCGRFKGKDIIIIVCAADILMLAAVQPVTAGMSACFTSLQTYTEYIKPASTFMYVIWQLAGTAVIICQYKWLQRSRIPEAEETRLIRFVYSGTIVMLMVLPFYRVSGVAGRIFRVWFIYMIIMQSAFSKRNFSINPKQLPFGLYNWGSLAWFYSIMFVITGRGTMTSFIADIVENNIFW